MAKKKSADDAEPKPVEAEAASSESKPEPKKRAPKVKPSGDDPVAETAPASEGAAPIVKKVKAPTEKKKKKKPGIPPARGKKLRNQLRNQRQKLEKEGTTSLKKAVSLL